MRPPTPMEQHPADAFFEGAPPELPDPNWVAGLNFVVLDGAPVVWLGQGRNVYNSPGNREYREMVRENSRRYQEAARNSPLKRTIPEQIIEQFLFAELVAGQVQVIDNQEFLVRKVQGDLRHSP